MAAAYAAHTLWPAGAEKSNQFVSVRYGREKRTNRWQQATPIPLGVLKSESLQEGRYAPESAQAGFGVPIIREARR